MYSPSEVELNETTKQVLDAVARANPNRVVFDSLSEVRLLRSVVITRRFFRSRKARRPSKRGPKPSAFRSSAVSVKVR